MYKIEKRFTFPMGHRLSKHKGRCFSIHGHNFTVLVGIKTMTLDDNDMVIDFADLKNIVNDYIDALDHCLLLNKTDEDLAVQLSDLGMRTMIVSHDPTAEKLSERLYLSIKEKLSLSSFNVDMDYVTVFENENSKATYMES